VPFLPSASPICLKSRIFWPALYFIFRLFSLFWSKITAFFSLRGFSPFSDPLSFSDHRFFFPDLVSDARNRSSYGLKILPPAPSLPPFSPDRHDLFFFSFLFDAKKNSFFPTKFPPFPTVNPLIDRSLFFWSRKLTSAPTSASIFSSGSPFFLFLAVAADPFEFR